MFRITYFDQDEQQEVTIDAEFEDTPKQSLPSGLTVGPTNAREWAEDYAYTMADKGHYYIRELVQYQGRWVVKKEAT